jgi:hypothetical protein
MAAITSITVKVDSENNAEAWWDAMRESLPALERNDPEVAGLLSVLERHGEVEISDPATIERFDSFVHSLPGFSDGPEYAREALIFEAN